MMQIFKSFLENIIISLMHTYFFYAVKRNNPILRINRSECFLQKSLAIFSTLTAFLYGCEKENLLESLVV